MTKNQAFTTLQKSGDARAARIITDKYNTPGRLWIWWAARQLRRGVPVAKIIHEKWFYALKFYTNNYTLDPRPDTETLVSAVLKEEGTKHKAQGTRILDLGTGTGCIIAAIIKNLPGATGVAIDKSWGALRVAKKNIRDLGLSDKIKVHRGTFHHPSSIIHHPFDIIVSNPPYIASNDERVNMGARHDPKMALFAKNNGLAAYESIAKNAKRYLKHGGKIYLEIGIDMGDKVREIFEKNGWIFLSGHHDLSGVERVLSFTIR